MPAPEIDTVIWRQLGNLIEVIHSDWRSIHSRGDQHAAQELAEAAGLHLVPAPDGMARWTRHPGAWSAVPSEVAR
jgi:hypothetical protein